MTYAISGGSASGCSVDGSGNVTASGPGTCIVTLSQPGDDSNYLAAPSIDVTVTFTKVSQSITAPSAPSGPWNTTLSVLTTASSGLTVTYSTAGGSASGCGVTTGGVVSATGAGTCVIDLNQSGNDDYAAASQIQVTANFSALNQTINAPASPTGFYTGSLSVFATATSGLTVTYSIASGTAPGCSVNAGGTVTATGTGTCVIYLNQAGDASWNAAPTVTVRRRLPHRR